MLHLISRKGSLTVFIILHLYVIICSFKASAQVCVKTPGLECKCVIEDSNRYIDLTPISEIAQSYFAESTRFKYQWNPCTISGFTCAKTSTAVCQRLKSDPTNYVYAAGDPTSTFDVTKTPPTISYTSKSDITRTSIISLTCSENAGTPSFTLTNEGEQGMYTFELQSKYACIREPSASGLSAGSILLIIFLILVILYIVGGVCFNLFYRHNSGAAQVLPNTQFWSSLPGLIKEGCLFIVCKGGSSGYQKV